VPELKLNDLRHKQLATIVQNYPVTGSDGLEAPVDSAIEAPLTRRVLQRHGRTSCQWFWIRLSIITIIRWSWS